MLILDDIEVLLSKEYEKMSRRLGLILTKLNNGEEFTIEELTDEFQVDKRTIQRDLNERLAYLPIEKKDGYYSIESRILGQLTFSDIKNFAAISGIKSLYPTLTNDFILDLLNNKTNKVFLIKNQGFENITIDNKNFENLRLSIINNQQIEFIYNSKKRTLNPYKLVNINGSWYLVADENNELKTYSFNKIKLLKITDKIFKNNKSFQKIISDNEVNWFSKDELMVLLEIDNSIVDYFFRKELLPNYKVIDKTSKTTILETKTSYEVEILNIVKYWIPNIKIIEPLELQVKLENLLRKYLDMT